LKSACRPIALQPEADTIIGPVDGKKIGRQQSVIPFEFMIRESCGEN
jgi:hypothetical protein